MFKENKYTKWYNMIINNAKDRFIDGYVEIHHIIPRCLGGDDSNDNLVRLTAREHFVCHMLLTKMHDDHRLKFAFIMMSVENPKQQRGFKITSSIYEYLKKCNSEASSIRSTGKQKHNVGKKLAYDPSTEEARLFRPEDTIPDHWILGSPPSRRRNQNGKNKGKVYYNNPETGEVIAINEKDTPPIGFVLGNPKAATFSSKDKILCYNPVTLESKRVKEIPDGWVKGSPFVWITDGKISKQIHKNSSLPAGFYYGRHSTDDRSKAIQNSRQKPLNTPLGIFQHPLRFIEKYDCKISIVSNLGGKINEDLCKKRFPILWEALVQANYDFTKTKSENGFYYIEDKHAKR